MMTMGARRCICVLCVALLASLVVTTDAFSVAPTWRNRSGGTAVAASSPRPPSPPLRLRNGGDNNEEKGADPTGDFYKNLGPIWVAPGFLFIGQICFLIAANLTSGLDNLEVYGELGNRYIRANGGGDQSKGLLERQMITQKGQKVWFDNVVRDLQNGGPVTPPLTEPLP